MCLHLDKCLIQILNNFVYRSATLADLFVTWGLAEVSAMLTTGERNLVNFWFAAFNKDDVD